MIYFISGHRDITKEEFDKFYIPKINEAIEIAFSDDTRFVVGDYEGADIMAQKYLKTLCEDGRLNYSQVSVYHMFDSPRHLASDKFNLVGGFKGDVERDSAMTEASDKDIAFIRKGNWTSGTSQNILRRYEKLEKKS